MKIRAIYDNGGETLDRYTIYYGEKNKTNNLYECIALSENPNSPLGFYQHTMGEPGRHNGKKIKLTDLPLECQKSILAELKE